MSRGDAVDMGDELLMLLQGKIPGTRFWQQEMFLAGDKPRGSQNKWWSNNAAEARFAQLKGDFRRANEVVTFTADWVARHPFTFIECLTPEEVYRGLQATGSYTLAGVAEKLQNPGYQTLLGNTAAHPAWLLLPCAPGPGRKVKDHQLDKVGQNVVLIGDGDLMELLYATQAGMRGWVRNRESGPKIFLFCDRAGLSAMLHLAFELKMKRSDGRAEWDRFEAIKKAFPSVPAWGLTPGQKAIGKAFLKDTANLEYVKEICRWLVGHEPELPFKITRYVDGSVAMQMLESHDSSTDCVAFDSWWAPNGVTKKMSAGSGARDNGGGMIEPMIGWEDEQFWYCQDKDRGEAPQKIAKPVGLRVAWTVEVRERVVVLKDGNGMTVDFSVTRVGPPNDGGVANPPKAGGKKRRRFNFS